MAHDPYSALRFRDFRYYLSARVFSTIGNQIQATIVGWQLYELTKNPLSLGLIGLTEAIPAIGLALFGGLLADTVNRRRIALICYLGLFISALLLAWFSLQPESVIKETGVLVIYVAVAVNGIARGFLSPAMFSLLSQMVPRNEYLSASTWNSTGWQLGAISGPALGGFIYALGGPLPCYLLVCGLTLLGMGLLIAIRQVETPLIHTIEPIKVRLFSGIHFVFKQPIILGALSLDLFAVLFGGAVALLPVFASDILKVGPEGLGILRAAPAAGSTLMAFLMAYRKPMKNAGINLLLAVAGFGITSIVFGLSESFWLSAFMLGIGGALDNVSVIIRSVILQMLTPDEMRGRVSAVNSIFIGSSNEIGAFESGVAASLLGIVPSVVFGGVMTLAVVGITWWKAPSLRRLDMRSLQQNQPEST